MSNLSLIVAKGDTPIYEQLYNQIVNQIMNGQLKADECLPSIRIVARNLGIGVITVKTTYEKLEASGFIYTRQGKGCFVSDMGIKTIKDKRSSLAEERLTEAVDYCLGLGMTPKEITGLTERICGAKEKEKSE